MSKQQRPRRKVAKFGGTSLADAAQVKKVVKIIKADPRIHFVVVSAPGKRYQGDTKVTDLLLAWFEAAVAKKNTAAFPLQIGERYFTIARALIPDEVQCATVVGKLFATLEQLERELSLQRCTKAEVLSRGEFLMGELMAGILGWESASPKDFIRFDELGGLPAWRLTADLIHNRFKGARGKRFVVPGFYGADLNGKRVLTFSRGGSDVTGALIAGALKIPYENWTDTDGLMTADPRVVPNATRVEHLTFAEAGEAAYLGMGALHSLTLYPLMMAGVEMWVKNTNNPSYPGTWILSELPEESFHPVRLITGRGGFSIVTVSKPLMNESLGMIARVSKRFAEAGISIEHMPGGVDSLSVVIDRMKTSASSLQACADGVSEALKADVVVEHDVALLCIIGQDMRRHVGVAAMAIEAIAHGGINIRLINQGASEVNITIGVEEKDLPAAIRAVHNTFFTESYKKPMTTTYIG